MARSKVDRSLRSLNDRPASALVDRFGLRPRLVDRVGLGPRVVGLRSAPFFTAC